MTLFKLARTEWGNVMFYLHKNEENHKTQVVFKRCEIYRIEIKLSSIFIILYDRIFKSDFGRMELFLRKTLGLLDYDRLNKKQVKYSPGGGAEA